MMDKLKMKSAEIINQNIEKIAEYFPGCISESAFGKVIDFDLLKQELDINIVEGNKERYRIEWPGKREAIVSANLSTNKTLRPLKEDSEDFDNTKNIYIEGDNLDVLKLLQESYLGRIKLIYIDPPYNTGTDLIYKDDFSKDKSEELFESGQKDEYDKRLVVNPDTAGRYHSNWLSMMYPRLKLARNLLSDEGVIFISIDDNEVHNLRKICDEIFGEINYLGMISRATGTTTGQDANDIGSSIDYLLVYRKSPNFFLNGIAMDESDEKRFSEEDDKGRYSTLQLRKTGNADRKEDRPLMFYPVRSPDGKDVFPIGPGGYNSRWRVGKTTFEKLKAENMIVWKESRNGEIMPYVKYYLDGRTKQVSNLWDDLEGNKKGSIELRDLFGIKGIFDNPKPTQLIERIIEISTSEDDIVLDFFAGSSSSAHAVLKHNANHEKNLIFIQVQVPALLDESTDAYKLGYKTIADIGKERIRLAAKKIKEETNAEIDYGFRVYRLDESNMQNVFYSPQEYVQSNIDMFADNIKPDRNSDDLLAQIMIDWGLELNLKIEQIDIAEKEVFKVDNDSLFACFDKGLDENFAREIAKYKPLRIVFRDSSFKDNSAKINVKQLLKQLSPETEMKVI
jgi:adenine-specific DNA-methyltransferase